MNWIAGIPSPSSGSLDIGPLTLNAYGAMIALGVVAAVWLSGKRLVQRGIGTTYDMSAIAMWAVPSGIVGARLYHVITDWQLFRNDLGAIVQIWKGGLGIWGRNRTRHIGWHRYSAQAWFASRVAADVCGTGPTVGTEHWPLGQLV